MKPSAPKFLLLQFCVALAASGSFAADAWVDDLVKACRKEPWTTFSDKTLETTHATLKKHIDSLTPKDYVDKELLETDARVRFVAFTWYSDLIRIAPGNEKAFKNCYEDHRESLKAIGDLMMAPEKKLAEITNLENCLKDFFRNTQVKSSSAPFGPLIACYKERAKKN